MDKPIPEAVAQFDLLLQRLRGQLAASSSDFAYVIVRDYCNELGDIYRDIAALTAAQQQGQAVAWPDHCTDCRGSTFETTHDNGRICVQCKRVYPPQPMQQGGGEAESARRLAVGLWQRHYREVAPEWEPCPGLAGLLSQIDNMASGLRRFDDTAPPSAPVGLDPPVERQRDMLAQAIRDAAVKAGIARADADMTGPMLLMLCNDLADCALAQQPAAVDEAAERLAEAVKGEPGWSSLNPQARIGKARRYLALATQHQEPTT